jgi:hypothetical protein
MIQVKWVAAIVLVYIIGFILGATYDMIPYTSAYGQTTQESTLTYLSDFGQTNTASTSGSFSIVSIPTTAPNYFSTLMNAAFLHFSFFQGTGYDVVYYLFILPFIALPGVLAVLYALYLMIVAILPF